MSGTASSADASRLHNDRGYSLIELLIAMAVLSVVSGTMIKGVLNMTKVHGRIQIRSEMHSSVRNATELLQQEVGQAGRVALPSTLTTGTAVGTPGSATINVTSVSGLFVGEQLLIDTGLNSETVALTGVNTVTNQFTATFAATHASGVPISVYGGFREGVIPEKNMNGTAYTDGSTGTTLKLFGDINGNGTMQYVEFTCDTAAGNLYRRSMAFDSTTKLALAADLVLLNNIKANPGGTACFTYEQEGANNLPYVVNVAITLTVETSDKDPITGVTQTETKALLNVSPRNVFNVWQLAGLGITNRVQPRPASITTLIGLP